MRIANTLLYYHVYQLLYMAIYLKGTPTMDVWCYPDHYLKCCFTFTFIKLS